MKKLFFSIQVIALLAMFPVYLVIELNHHQEKPFTVNQVSFAQIQEIATFQKTMP